ncbi:MAG TPA: heparan-alpha-glucosaminide N-acetyltransferase domain-containing protein [Verrucomicrobiae bacterium]|nr:heparan-alpha-glucosaminide N-acetyltransferase domain-containing protein [Verrucomicrobiae bacterium]
MPSPAPSAAAQNAPIQTSFAHRRLVSLDALRGFDMFWILGADSLAYSLHAMSQSKTAAFFAYELNHSQWQGFRFYDLIFPLFVFIAGVSMVFSLGKTIASAGRAQALKRIFIRSLLLYALGIFEYGGFEHLWPGIRLLGVLQRIALAYFFTGLCFCFFRPRTLVAICAGLLIGYWALMTFVPFPDVRPTPQTQFIGRESGLADLSQLNMASTNYIRGVFLEGVNLSNYLDQKYLPGYKWDGTWDPEGMLSTIPAVGTCLLGVFAGLLLKDQKIKDGRKVVCLLSFGVAGIALGWLWGLQFPVIKKIWTSSYVLVAGGYSALLLGAFYQIVDVWKWQRWCRPFVWIGMNSITLYMADNILDGFATPAQRLVGGNIKAFFDAHVAQGFGELMIAITGLLLVFWFARLLYQRKVFLRL